MMQDPVPDAGPPPLHQPPPPTHPLAIGSVVCAALFFIPLLAPIIGVLLGVIAITKISSSNGRFVGKSTAIIGAAISAFMLLVHVGGTVMLVKGMNYAMNKFEGAVQPSIDAFAAFLEDLESGDLAAARNRLTKRASNAVTDAELSSLRERLAIEYGQITSVKFDFSTYDKVNPLMAEFEKLAATTAYITPLAAEVTGTNRRGVVSMLMNAPPNDPTQLQIAAFLIELQDMNFVVPAPPE